MSASKVGLNVCIYRLGEIYGPGRWIEERLKRSYQKKFSGDGSPYTNLIHLNDIVSAVNLAINQNLQGIYNLCNDFHIPRRDFYDLLCKKHNIPTIQWDDQLATPHGGNKRVDNQKMKETGFVFSSLPKKRWFAHCFVLDLGAIRPKDIANRRNGQWTK